MRAIGGLGMSVGTSLAFEGEGASSIATADTILLNLKTLVRNARQAYEKEDKEADDPEQLANDVASDLKLIAEWIQKHRGAKTIQMKVYSPSYSRLKADFPHGHVVDHSSDKATKNQRAYYELSKKVVSKLVERFKDMIQVTAAKLPDFAGKGIVLTHHVVDLVTVTGVSRLFLLESHTGALKPFTQWYSKLTGGKDLHYMPFNRLTIQIFGDNSTNFKAHSHGIRELVKKLAVEHRWTSATTLGRIRGTINNLPESVDKAGLKLFL